MQTNVAGVKIHERYGRIFASQCCGRANRHHGTVFGNVRAGDGHVFALHRRARAHSLKHVCETFGLKRHFVPGRKRGLRKQARGGQQASDDGAVLKCLATGLHKRLLKKSRN